MNSKKHMVVTIAREFGSGGHEIGQIIAKDLGLDFYDGEIIKEAASRSGYHEDYVRENEEKAPSFASSMFSPVDTFQSHPSDQIQIEEHKFIKELGEKGGCVIVGRGADYILNDIQHVSVFLFAPINDRLERVKQQASTYMIDENKAHSDAAILKSIKTMDKQRRKYYEFYTDFRWGARDTYDLLINTSRTGIDGAAKIIETYILECKDKNLLSD